MKLNPLFKVKNNQLFSISAPETKIELNFSEINDLESLIPLENKFFYKIFILQNTVETEPECYNEEYLAKLRDYLKSLEEKKQFAVLCIIPNKISDNVNSVEVESYISSVKHTTRRIKDCENLVGIWICAEYAQNGDNEKISLLIDELEKKHPHYIYFSSNQIFEKAKKLGEKYSSKIVIL